MPLPFDVFGAYWRPKSNPAICGDRYTSFALSYSLPAWPRNTKVGGAFCGAIRQVAAVKVAGRQELEGGHAVVEDADQAVGLAGAHDTPVITGEVGEGAPHIQRLQRGVARCARTAAAADLAGEVLPNFDRRTIAQAVGRHAVTAGIDAPKAVNRSAVAASQTPMPLLPTAVQWESLRRRRSRGHRASRQCRGRVADTRPGRRGHQVIVEAGPRPWTSTCTLPLKWTTIVPGVGFASAPGSIGA